MNVSKKSIYWHRGHQYFVIRYDNTHILRGLAILPCGGTTCKQSDCVHTLMEFCRTSIDNEIRNNN